MTQVATGSVDCQVNLSRLHSLLLLRGSTRAVRDPFPAPRIRSGPARARRSDLETRRPHAVGWWITGRRRRRAHPNGEGAPPWPRRTPPSTPSRACP
ncbi:hypothetical protein MICRO116_610018 [Micrococcus sp. 116]|nr:hypothetical protein MICRO116_610018 [Micrococcus sp. 116]